MVTRSELYARFYSGDVVEKLAAAQDLYGRYGKELALRPDIMSQLAAMESSERAMAAQKGTMGMGATCTQCAGRQGGGCCSPAGIWSRDGVKSPFDSCSVFC